jgi:hypothetical protein
MKSKPSKAAPKKTGKRSAAKPKATAAKSKPTNALRHMMRGADRQVEARDTDPRASFSTGGRDHDVDGSRSVRPRRG